MNIIKCSECRHRREGIDCYGDKVFFCGLSEVNHPLGRRDDDFCSRGEYQFVQFSDLKPRDKDEPMYVCQHCLDYLKSKGKKILVGQTIETEDFELEESRFCQWCGDAYDELIEIYY